MMIAMTTMIITMMMLLLMHVRGRPSALKSVLRLTPVTGAPVQPR